MTARCKLDFWRPVDLPLPVFPPDMAVLEASAGAPFDPTGCVVVATGTSGVDEVRCEGTMMGVGRGGGGHYGETPQCLIWEEGG